jgi:hypothetical protein
MSNVNAVELLPDDGANTIPVAAGEPGGSASTEIDPATSNTSIVAASTVPTAATSRSRRRVFGEFVCIVEGPSGGSWSASERQRRGRDRSRADGRRAHRTGRW